jgi:hypothetical protein
VKQAVGESRKLVEEQNRIREELGRLAKDKAQSSASEDARQRREDLVSRKAALADRLRNLENQIRDLSRQARKTQKETSNKLAEAAGTIQEKRLPERITSGNTLIQNGYYESQQQREDFIRDGLTEVNQQLEAAQSNMGQTKQGKIEEAANRARQLSEGLESMQQRMLGAQRGGQQGQQRGQDQGQNQTGRQTQDARGARESRGQNPQDPRGGMPDSDAVVRGPSGNTFGPPAGIGAHRDEDERQLNRELEQRLTDARDLRRLLDRNSTQMENLDKVIESLRRAGDYKDYRNPEQIARLKAAIDHMRKVELDLARDLDRLNQGDKYFFAEDNEAPSSYQKLVEEYYKSLAKSK